LHQGEPHRFLILEPLTPAIERVFGKALLLAELLHGNSAALLRSDSPCPLLGFARRAIDHAARHDKICTTLPPARKRGWSAVYANRHFRSGDPQALTLSRCRGTGRGGWCGS